MKRLLAFIFALIVMFSFTGCKLLEDLSLLYAESVYVENLHICINDTAGCCFAGPYTCEEYTYGMEITIPDEYEGKPIKHIGGYYGRGFPTPFYFGIDALHISSSDEENYIEISTIDEVGYKIVDLPYVLNIGKNVDSIVYVENEYYTHIEDDGSVVYYHPVVSINCSEENKHFYSENGRLYSRKTNELVEDFDYAD
ncbi:MAG: hypothetical protein IJD93_03005 [Ruminococcus sp.]|nr:hypothetical protein [Ruminococcus sp.]